MARNNKINFGYRRAKKKVIYLACEGGSTGTEGTYIRDLCQKYNCVLMANAIYKGSADPVTLAKATVDFAKKTPKRPGENFEIWVVFDNDDPIAVKEAFRIIEEYNKFLRKNCVPINIAFNAPCIETWGLLCCGVRPNSENSAVLQKNLSLQMSSYNHQRYPRFDFNKMEEGYEGAVKIAIAWQQSLAGIPEYTATIFAGIYKLVESIKS